MNEKSAKDFCDSLENTNTSIFNEDISIDIIDTDTMKILKYKGKSNITKFEKLKFWLINLYKKVKNIRGSKR